MKSILRTVSLLTLSTATLSSTAFADTLQEALAAAYRTNPTITGARAAQRANDENVAIARARQMPTANAQSSLTETFSIGPGTSAPRVLRVGVGADYQLYDGGGLKNSIYSAQSRVVAGQYNLLGTESDVFVAAVTAYMDVLRDEAIVGLNKSNIKLLKTNLEATSDRFEVGDLTRTDVAQSEARLALAQSRLESAEANLIASRELYVRIIGNEPGALAPPPPLPNMPTSVTRAVEIALADNTDIDAIENQRKAAEFDVKVIKSQRLPRVGAGVDANYGNFLWDTPSQIVNGQRINQPNSQHSLAAGVTATFPLFTGGANAAQVRQTQARLGQTIEQTIEVERGVIAQTRSAYAFWSASKSVISSTESAIKANRLALEGVTAENTVGTRTILDILDARQDLLNSEVELVTARRNEYVAGFQLLAVMGHAQFADLNLDGVAMYDPNVNYKRADRKMWDWKGDWRESPAPSAEASRTVDTPPQTPALYGPPTK